MITGSDLNKLQDVLRSRHQQRSVVQRQKEEELVSLFFFALKELIDSQLYLPLLNDAAYAFSHCRLFCMQILLMLKHRRKSKLQFDRLIVRPYVTLY